MIQKKIPVLGVSALLLLLALTIALTALVLNIDQLRSGLAAYITQQTERNVTIGSDVEIGLGFSGSGSLLLTLKAEDVVVYNNPDFSAEPLFHAPWLELEFRLLSILSGELDVRSLLIERPRFDLIRLTDGRSNWQDIGVLAVAPAKQVNVYAGRVHWHDRMTQQIVTLADLSWRSIRSETDSTIAREVSFQLLSEELRAPLAVRLSAKSSSTHSQPRGVVLNEVVGHVTTPGLVLSMRLPEISVDIDRGRIHVAESAVSIGAAGAEAALKIADLSIDTRTRQIRIALLDADCFIGRFAPGITADAITIDLSNQRIVVPKLAVSWLGAELFADLSAAWAGGEPELLADFDVPSVNVQTILHNAGIVLTGLEPNRLRPISLNGKLRFRQNQLTLDDLNVKAGDTVVTGWFRHRRGDPAAWTFALESDSLLLADKAEDGSLHITSAGVLVGLLVERLSDLPADVTAAGSIAVEQLWVDRIQAEHVIATIRAKGKVLSIAPLSGQLYSGAGQLFIWLDRRADAPLILVRQTVGDFNLGKLLRDADDIAGIEATGDLNFVLAMQGRTGAELLKNARGAARVSLRNGELSAELFDRVLGHFDTELVAVISAQLPVLNVEQASTSIRIDRGVIHNPDLRLTGRGFWIEGKGSLSVSVGAVDYRILLALEDDLNSGLGGVPVIPFQITGSVGDPKITLDVQELVRYKIEQELTGVSPRPSSVLPDQATITLIQRLERQIANLQQVLDPE
ncbi:MAG: AsmA family protein [Gammaproteobacteria bacterium]|nr:AsmA family protein [Gammaproteobacteria bacterium]HHZ72168.1 AsmA family protein [Gammaproteobacteria bacterium]HIA42273.1 AsmA family protein [Gammaproteobacteria bacterium]HIC21685.1 AsmA family protein [Gammaproteobacteria bacterium]HIN43186.1 AsmA family protein [Gammaproteobacteria bacterium]